MAKKDITQIQDCTNKAWVLGGTHFKNKIEEKTGAPSQPTGRGGDRKSVQYRYSIKGSDPVDFIPQFFAADMQTYSLTARSGYSESKLFTM